MNKYNIDLVSQHKRDLQRVKLYIGAENSYSRSLIITALWTITLILSTDLSAKLICSIISIGWLCLTLRAYTNLLRVNELE